MVSIIIVSFNTKEITKQCLLSIKKYVDLGMHEVVVVDNGSSDGSVKMLQQFKWVKLIANRENLGFAKANNQGIRVAKGDDIFLLNSDTEFLNNATLPLLVNAAGHLPTAGAVVPRLLNSDGSDQESVFHLPTIGRAIKAYWFGKRGWFQKYLPLEMERVALTKKGIDEVYQVEAAVMAAMLIPRAALEQVGRLDEGYFMYFEDLEFCRRLKNNGLKVYYVSKAMIKHHHGQSGKNLANAPAQWKRLIPSSKRYHGWLRYYLIQGILWSGQKLVGRQDKAR